MNRLRRAHTLARLVLLWFVLFIGVAVASPIVSPTSTQMVCSGSGAMKLVSTDDNGGSEIGSSTLDCPVCSPMGFALPMTWAPLPVQLDVAHALAPVVAARIAARIGLPWQARAPPASLLA